MRIRTVIFVLYLISTGETIWNYDTLGNRGRRTPMRLGLQKEEMERQQQPEELL
jgi:hypothetical protein